MKFINHKKFTAIVLDANNRIFIMHTFSLKTKILIKLAQEAKIVSLLAKNVIISEAYLNIADVFSKSQLHS